MLSLIGSIVLLNTTLCWFLVPIAVKKADEAVYALGWSYPEKLLSVSFCSQVQITSSFWFLKHNYVMAILVQDDIQ